MTLKSNLMEISDNFIRNSAEREEVVDLILKEVEKAMPRKRHLTNALTAMQSFECVGFNRCRDAMLKMLRGK